MVLRSHYGDHVYDEPRENKNFERFRKENMNFILGSGKVQDVPGRT